MSTSYREIRNFIRSFLGDFDSSCFTYTDAILNSQIDLVIAELDDVDIAFGTLLGKEPYFATDLTNKNKVRIAIRVALNIIAPQPEVFSYSTPVVSVRRQRGGDKLYFYLKEKLDEVEGNTLVIETDTDIDAFFNYFTRFADDLNNAFANK